MNLLIVDDQKSVFLYLQKVLDLQALGYETVRYAENGQRALNMILEEPPDVMLLDIQMPVMNGLTLLETLRSKGIVQPETAVLSAYDEFDYARKCIDFNVRSYVLKPIDPAEMRELLIKMAERVQETPQQTTKPESFSESSDADTLARIRDYINAHPGEELSLAAMADRFFISRFQISRLFKQLYGVNYQDYILSVRMELAAGMLSRTHARLYEIAAAAGFDEPSYFSSVFKRYYGMSPREYRQKKGGEIDE